MSRTAAELDSLVGEIEGGRRVFAFAADLPVADCEAAVAAAVTNGGGLQILVNNAGVGGFAPVAETTDEEWDRILATNLTAVFRLTREALPHLARQGGHVFMVSSLAGQNPIAGMAAYCASKAALDHFGACLMLEVRQQGVKVTTLAPGSVDTDFGRDGGRADASWMLTAEDVPAPSSTCCRSATTRTCSRGRDAPGPPPEALASPPAPLLCPKAKIKRSNGSLDLTGEDDRTFPLKRKAGRNSHRRPVRWSAGRGGQGTVLIIQVAAALLLVLGSALIFKALVEIDAPTRPRPGAGARVRTRISRTKPDVPFRRAA